MTSPYITAAVAACRLDVQVFAAECYSNKPGLIQIVVGDRLSKRAFILDTVSSARDYYTALRNRLLMENEG